MKPQTPAHSQAGAGYPGSQGSVPGSLVTYFCLLPSLEAISQLPQIRKNLRVPNTLKVLGAV